jgi:hypothetical protein
MTPEEAAAPLQSGADPPPPPTTTRAWEETDRVQSAVATATELRVLNTAHLLISAIGELLATSNNPKGLEFLRRKDNDRFNAINIIGTSM